MRDFVSKPLRYFGQTTTSYQSQTPYGNNKQAGHYAVASDGAKIYYEIYGVGAPMVVLHGGLVGSLAEMSEFIDKLRLNYQVIAINSRGHGKSQVGHAQPTYAQKAKDIQAVLQAANIERKVTLLGFSDGAYSALTFAAQYPSQTEAVIAIGAGEWMQGFIQGGLKERMGFEQIYQLDPEYWQEQQAIRPKLEQTESWFESAQRNYDQTQVGVETFGKIQVPVLFIVGEKDENAPLETVISAYQMTPHANLSVIPNAPHPVFMMNFPAVWTVVAPFLAYKNSDKINRA